MYDRSTKQRTYITWSTSEQMHVKMIDVVVIKTYVTSYRPQCVFMMKR
jgi:hypothetical protein